MVLEVGLVLDAGCDHPRNSTRIEMAVEGGDVQVGEIERLAEGLGVDVRHLRPSTRAPRAWPCVRTGAAGEVLLEVDATGQGDRLAAALASGAASAPHAQRLQDVRAQHVRVDVRVLVVVGRLAREPLADELHPVPRAQAAVAAVLHPQRHRLAAVGSPRRLEARLGP
jgi:hypothetical protein